MVKVAAAIIEENGKIFVCKRKEGGVCAYLWEFPGGKLEPGETPEEALIRECREELDAMVEPLGLFAEFPYSYPDRDIYFYFIRAKIVSGDVKLLVHTDSKWESPSEMKISEYCPADKDVIQKLCAEFNK